jgi:non-ribosomal peptide synthetase component F
MSPYTNGTGASHEAGAEDTSGGVLSNFDKYVTSDPNRCAVVFENEQVSYQELDQRSRRLAEHLKNNGVGLESTVPFCIEKSVHAVVAIVAIVAILRSGAAFAAVLPTSPEPRKRYIIQACHADVILCSNKQKTLIKGLCSSHIVVDDLPRLELAINGGSETNSCSFPVPLNSNAACVIFTSGSTGGESIHSLRRKGPMIIESFGWCSSL